MRHETTAPPVSLPLAPTTETQQALAGPAVQPLETAGLDAGLFERLARAPEVTLEKLQALVALQERIMAREAKMAFDQAFAAMQADLPVIAELGKTDKGRYARFEDIVRQVRPILKAHGFSLSFATAWPGEGRIEITGILTHRAGHDRRSVFVGQADRSGSKNEIQAQGSTTTYGRRYTTLDLLGIATADDDGQASAASDAPMAPEGFDDWLLDLRVLAETDGSDALAKAWETSPKANKKYLIQLPGGQSTWHTIKALARKADKKSTVQP